MPATQLNDITVRNLPPPAAGQVQYPDGRISGFGVRVTSTGRKTFYLAYRAPDGRSRRLTIGRYPHMSLGTARAQAMKALAELAAGRDPQAASSAKTAASSPSPAAAPDTFAETVELFVRLYLTQYNRPSSAAETERLLRRNFLPFWKTRPLSEITKADVLTAMDAMVARGAPGSANHAFAAIRKLFNWCVERGFLETSPCQSLRLPSKPKSRDRVLSDSELVALWHASAEQGYPFGPLFQLLLVTAQRRGEVVGMTWDEIDFEARLWAMSGGRTKNGKPHVVPLSDLAIAILRAQPRFESPFVFPARGKPDRPYSGYSKGKRELDALAGLRDWTLHDLRRTAATRMAELGVPPHVVEKILNHLTGSFGGVAGVYNRFSYQTEMREALDVWGAHIGKLTVRK